MSADTGGLFPGKIDKEMGDGVGGSLTLLCVYTRSMVAGIGAGRHIF